MARIVSITVQVTKTDAVLAGLSSVKNVFEIQVYRGASMSPPGDVIKVAVPNSSLNSLMTLLDAHGLGDENGISMSSSDPDGIIVTHSVREIERDNNAATWEEMALTISDDSNMTANTLCAMFLAGVLAAVGIATNALHIVVGGMLIAPGFMPITRVALGMVAKSRTWRYGVIDFIKGYSMLIAGAMLTTVILKVFGQDPLPGVPSYYAAEKYLVEYWTTINVASVLASFAAGIAGGLLVASKRSVFTSGVMIGLALVPSAALIGMGLLEGDVGLTLRALLRLVIDVFLVLTSSTIVLVAIRLYSHRRDLVF